MDYPAEATRIVVVADNCTDSTPTIARGLGAECLERVDPEFPGKPRAIAWALARFDLSQWDACVIVDADSTVATDFAKGLSELSPLNDIVFQPNNLVLNEFETWLTRLGGLLGRCRFEVTFPLKQSSGLNCPIGNGMGIGTGLLIRDGWRSFSITEDSELYAIYTEAGVPIRHASAANIYSQESRSLGEGATQRRRWLGGRIRVIRDLGGQILRSTNIGWRQKLDIFVELGLTSPVLNLMIALAVAAVALFAIGGTEGRWIAALATSSLSGIFATTAVGIWRHPQPGRTLFAFLMLPVYAVWRLVVFASTIVTLGDTTWRRTSRTAPQISIAQSNP
jgi:cellulose synthase/poly-beta-1,6-N-acetylglucosamine synthase-like glycosyltransferase